MRLAAAMAAAMAAAGAALAEPAPVRAGFETDPDDAAALLAQFERGCPAVDAFAYSTPERPARVQGELLLLCHALRAGGYAGAFAPTYGHSYNRSLAETAAGRLDLPTQTVWESDVAAAGGALIAAAPLIRRGEWVVGLYTAESRADVLAADTVEGVRALTAAAPRGWVEDWRALEAIGMRVVDVQQNALIPAMIERGAADVTLMAFAPGPDMARVDRGAGRRMLPLRGFAVAIPTARVWAVSAARPDAAELVAAIDRGLAVLREQGVVERVLRDVGVLIPAVDGWTRLP